MATYYVWSGGSNTSPYDTWAKAATAFGTAITAANAAGDVIKVHYTHQEELAADTTYTFAGNVSVISVNKDSSDALTEMGTGGWIGNSTTSRSIGFAGSDRSCRVWGITLRNAGTANTAIGLTGSSGQDTTFENCYFWLGTTGTSASIRLATSFEAKGTAINCTFRFGSNAHSLRSESPANLIKCSVSSAGTAPLTLFGAVGSASTWFISGCDFSHITDTIVPNYASQNLFYFDRCVFYSTVTLFAAQTSNPTKASTEAFFSDCMAGTTRFSGHYNALGSSVTDSGIYYTDGAAGKSLRVVTTANASYRNPYYTLWIDWYNTGTSAITPYFEILRDGSTTAYTDAQVWGEFSWKNTSSSPIASGLQNDWQGLAAATAGTAGTNQTTGAGTGSWTGEAGSAWSGKVDSGSSITPTESGHIRGRVAVGAASITVYVDPFIRT